MAAVSSLIAIGGAALSAGSSIIGSQNEAAALQQQAAHAKRIGELNARQAEHDADRAIKVGDREAISLKTQARGIIGSQRAALAAQGIEVDSGSAADVQADTKLQAELDAQKIKNNAWREAFGFKMQALQYREGAAMQVKAAKNAADSTLLTGGLRAAGTAAGAAYNYSRGGK